MAQYANIIVDISLEKLDQTFQYIVPEKLRGLVQEGMRVWVPFGRGNRRMKGYITGLGNTPEFEPGRMKEILSLVENEVAVESRLMLLAAWMRRRYGGTMNQALKTVLPVKAKLKHKQERCISLLLPKEDAAKRLAEYEKKHYTARYRLLAALLEYGTLDYGIVIHKLNVTAALIKTMAEQHIISICEKQAYRNPLEQMIKKEESLKKQHGASRWASKHELGKSQQEAVNAVAEEMASQRPKPCLLYGVTGSGKTEVYMELIERVVKEKKQAIVLIPEIALTFQTVMRFYYRFGGQVSILNSKMSAGERYDQYTRAKNGEISVMIGPRSALFTPFENIGIIIIDEEHESSYKSDTTPRYQAGEVAGELSRMCGAQLVLGSATPSLESYYRAKGHEYRLVELKERVQKKALPQVDVVDMREELKQGNRSIFSRQLASQMEETLKRGEQCMLFLNRRGIAGFVSCRSCGEVIKCPHCDVSLSEHLHGRLVCHYCGYETKNVRTCPACGSNYIGGFKAGTEKVELLVRKMFPQARVLRMDADTTRKKGGYERILSAFANHEADILIGTQMIVKGHDFGAVTLVGVLAADLSLHVGDYRASERTFQLLTQAAGRAGRGMRPGYVVIQTYSPGHYSIQAAQNQDYETFYSQEILYREMASYPPVSNMLLTMLSCGREEELENCVESLKKLLEKFLNQKTKSDAAQTSGENKDFGQLKMIGPADAPVAKINDIYRKVLYVKHLDYEKLVMVKDFLEEETKKHIEFRNIMIQYNFNPL